MRVLSLFAGAGGLDRGFENAGFEIVWANEYDKAIWETFRLNFGAILDTRSIADVPSTEMPDNIDGIIGGPPCQSWSEFGSKRGIADQRGQLFFEYARVIRDKRPKFFLAENVSGILAERHRPALERILRELRADYVVPEPRLLNANGFGVPQDRERVIFVGYRKDLGKAAFSYPEPILPGPTLRDAIWDLRKSAVPAAVERISKQVAKRDKDGNKLCDQNGKVLLESMVVDRNNCANKRLVVPNHEYFVGDYSPHYMSRNRVRGWDEPSFTIQAGARHAPMHPQASPMVCVGKDKFRFDGDLSLYRRLSVRECARVQTFPDDFEFVYTSVGEGYKMVGNAVPVKFAEALARKIKADFE